MIDFTETLPFFCPVDLYIYHSVYKTKTYCFIAALFFLLKPAPVFAQADIVAEKVLMRQLTVDDGLSQGFMYDGLQDKKGFLWFATMDGLNRYDGYNFTVFRHDPDNPFSLPENGITSLAEDDNGNLWIGTSSKGLCVMDKKTERIFQVPVVSTFTPDSNYSIHKLTLIEGRLYINTGKGIVIIRARTVATAVYEGQQAMLARQPVTSVAITTEDFINGPATNGHMITCYGYGSLHLYLPDKSFTQWTEQKFTPEDLELDHIDRFTKILLPSSLNGFFILQEGNIFFYDLQRRKKTLKGTYPALSVLYATLLDNSIHFTCEVSPYESTFFVFNYKDNTLKRYEAKNNGRILQAMFKDRTGGVWMSTDAKGVRMLNRQGAAFKTIINKPWRFLMSTEGMLNKVDDNVYEYIPSTGVNKKIVSAKDIGTTGLGDNYLMLKDRGNTFWRMGCYDCPEHSVLYAYNVNTKKLTRHDWAFKRVHFMFADNNNQLWVLHRPENGVLNNYLARIDSGNSSVERTFRFPVTQINGDSRFVLAAWQDAKGIIWFTTDVGLFALDPTQSDEKKAWRHWQNIPGDNSSLSGDKLLALCPDPKEPQKYFWVGTRGAGFNRFEMATGKCVRYSEKDGLPNNVAYDIMPDNLGNLWVSTNMGLSCFTPPYGQNAKAKFRNFTEEDGLADNEFNGLTGRKTPGGELAFQGVQGVSIFNPEEILQELDTVPIRFTSLSVNNKVLEWEMDPAIIPATLAYCQQVKLTHDQNSFSISFSSIDYRNTKGKLYSWRLEGFEKSWTEPSPQHSVTYTNLDPGTYYFHVKGTNCDGVWNEKGNTIKIVIRPAWYQTMLFKIALLLLVLGSFYALYRYRLQQQVRLLKVRNNIASDLHDEIGSTLSSVSISSTIIQQKLDAGNSEVHGLLDQISTNTDNMMEAMSDIVWAINSKNDRFDNVTNRMRAFAIEILEPKDCALHFNVDDQLEALTLDMSQRKNLYLLYKEAINNAAKYSGCKNLWVNISKDRGRKILLSIKDDGKGFNPPSDTNTKSAVLGGNGLNNMQQRAVELGGTLKINSTPGNGTEVLLEFGV